MTRAQANRILALWRDGAADFSLAVINAALHATGDLNGKKTPAVFTTGVSRFLHHKGANHGVSARMLPTGVHFVNHPLCNRSQFGQHFFPFVFGDQRQQQHKLFL